MKSRLFSHRGSVPVAIMVIALALFAASVPAWADTNNVSYWDPTDNTSKSQNCTVLDTTTDDTITLTDGWYVLNADANRGKGYNVSGNVNLILQDGVKLSMDRCGIDIQGSSTLTVYQQKSDAQYDAIGSTAKRGAMEINNIYESGIAIHNVDASTFVMNGGDVSANGANNNAAIGGHGDQYHGQWIVENGGNVVINGGVLYAHTASGAAIGGGADGGNGGNVTINGGNVTAYTGAGAAAIGGGCGNNAGYGGGEGGTIIINGGTVNAKSDDAAALGAAQWSSGTGNVTINGGNVTATSGNGATAINANNINLAWTNANDTYTFSGGQTMSTEPKEAPGAQHVVFYAVDPDNNMLDYTKVNTAKSATLTPGFLVTYHPGDGAQPGDYRFFYKWNDNRAAILVDRRDGGIYKTGYAFDGWQDGSARYNTGDTVNFINDKVELTAMWKMLDPVDYIVPNGMHFDTLTCTEYEKFDGYANSLTQNNGNNGWYVIDGQFKAQDRLVVKGDVNIILVDGAKLDALAGIQVDARDQNSSLTIYAQSTDESTMGTINAESHEGDCAAIGAGPNDATRNPMTITINGGNINATSYSEWGAGIGGQKYNYPADDTINIHAGNVVAIAAGNSEFNWAPAIGTQVQSGSTGDDWLTGHINIDGGKVKALGQQDASHYTINDALRATDIKINWNRLDDDYYFTGTWDYGAFPHMSTDSDFHVTEWDQDTNQDGKWIPTNSCSGQGNPSLHMVPGVSVTLKSGYEGGPEDVAYTGKIISNSMQGPNFAAPIADEKVFVRDGYVLSGWKSGTGATFKPGDSVLQYTGITLTAQWTENPVKSIAVTKKPAKTAYKAGEDFDANGMEVTATYADGSTKIITDYTVKNGKALKAGTKALTISYTENDKTVTATVAITVAVKALDVTPPNGNGSSNNNGNNNQAPTTEDPANSVTPQKATATKTDSKPTEAKTPVQSGKVQSTALPAAASASTPSTSQAATSTVKTSTPATSDDTNTYALAVIALIALFTTGIAVRKAL